MWRRFLAWLDRSEDARVLEGLDDRMLEDMGIARREIRARVGGKAAGAGAAARTEAGQRAPAPMLALAPASHLR